MNVRKRFLNAIVEQLERFPLKELKQLWLENEDKNSKRIEKKFNLLANENYEDDSYTE
jgi:hypothetical protein